MSEHSSASEKREREKMREMERGKFSNQKRITQLGFRNRYKSLRVPLKFTVEVDLGS